VSEKFRFYKRQQEKYNFAFDLMQRRFVKYEKGELSFQDGYMEYLKENFTLEDERVYTLTREFTTFLTDYIGYYDHNKICTFYVSTEEVRKRVLKNNELSTELKVLSNELDKLLSKLESDNRNEELREECIVLLEKLFSFEEAQETSKMIMLEHEILDSSTADSLIFNFQT